MSSVPTIDRFVEVLSTVPKWYDLGVFLGVPIHELDSISLNYRSEGTTRCLVEIYKSVENVFAKKEKPLLWQDVAEALRRMNNHSLASEIYVQHLMPSASQSPESALQKAEENVSQVDPTEQRPPMLCTITQPQAESQLINEGRNQLQTSSSRSGSPNNGDTGQHGHVSEIDVPPKVAKMFWTVINVFTALTLKVKHALSDVPLEDLQDVILQTCDLKPLPGEQATIQNVIRRLQGYYCFLNLDILEFIIGALLANKPIHNEISQYKKLVNQFKLLSEMRYLVGLITEKEKSKRNSQKKVTLKLREFWSEITVNKFEKAMQKILKTLYKCASHITVTEGCICVSWFVPDRPSSSFIIPEPEDKEFIKLIGVVFLHIDDDVIYDIPGDGCETMEAALLQAIELKNKQAIELLIYLGCDSGIGIYNEHVSITTIVEIRDREKAAGSVKHDHVFGQNIQVLLCTDGSSQQSPAHELREKMLRNLVHENDILQSRLAKKEQQLQESLESAKVHEDTNDVLKLQLAKKEHELQKVLEFAKAMEAERPTLGLLWTKEELQAPLRLSETGVEETEKPRVETKNNQAFLKEELQAYMRLTEARVEETGKPEVETENIQVLLSTDDSSQQSVAEMREKMLRNLIRENDVLQSRLVKKEQQLQESLESAKVHEDVLKLQLAKKEQELQEIREFAKAEAEIQTLRLVQHKDRQVESFERVTDSNKKFTIKETEESPGQTSQTKDLVLVKDDDDENYFFSPVVLGTHRESTFPSIRVAIPEEDKITSRPRPKMQKTESAEERGGIRKFFRSTIRFFTRKSSLQGDEELTRPLRRTKVPFHSTVPSTYPMLLESSYDDSIDL